MVSGVSPQAQSPVVPRLAALPPEDRGSLNPPLPFGGNLPQSQVMWPLFRRVHGALQQQLLLLPLALLLRPCEAMHVCGKIGDAVGLAVRTQYPKWGHGSAWVSMGQQGSAGVNKKMCKKGR